MATQLGREAWKIVQSTYKWVKCLKCGDKTLWYDFSRMKIFDKLVNDQNVALA